MKALKDTYKAKIRIATREYCYVEVEVEDTFENIFEAHGKLQQIHFPVGIPEKEMNSVVDKMLQGISVNGGIEIYEKMSQSQKYAAQTIKRALKRLEAREDKPVVEMEDGPGKGEKGDYSSMD